MSAIVTATFEGQLFRLEITGDGILVFLDYDIDYDLSMVEFGEPKTIAIDLADEWLRDPIQMIVRNMYVSPNILSLLALDWADHMLPIMERSRTGSEPSHVIKSARSFIKGKISLDELTQICVRAGTPGIAGPSGWAARAVIELAEGEPGMVIAAAENVALRAQETRGRSEWMHASPLQALQKKYAAEKLERAWQIHRFVHVMEHTQDGKPWPLLEATP